MACSVFELILVSIWPASPYLTLPLHYMTLLGHDPSLQRVLGSGVPLQTIALFGISILVEEAEFAPALLKQGRCAGSTVSWLRGRQSVQARMKDTEALLALFSILYLLN